MWTVGLVATLISISSIIAADTFAFIGGKVHFFLGLSLFDYSSLLSKQSSENLS